MFWAVLRLDIAVIIIHILALTLLMKKKQNNVKGCQRTLLIALCMTELSYAVLNIGLELLFNTEIGDILFTFTLTCVLLLYVFIMFLITIDRFLEFYLNIKYKILWSPKKTMLALLFGVIISLFSLIPSYLVGISKTYDFLILYMFPLSEAIFFIVASSIYFYNTKQVLRHRRNILQLQKQLQSNNKVVHHGEAENRFKIFLPTLIILTFILFMVGSSILSLLDHFEIYKGAAISFILIPIGYIVDPIIYIYNLKPIRSEFKRIVRRYNFIYPGYFNNLLHLFSSKIV